LISKRCLPVEDLDEFNQPTGESTMKKRGATDAKKSAANDKPETEAKKADAPKATKTEKPAERYQIGQTDTVKRGFLKEFCDFTRKKGTVTSEMLVAEFAGRQIDGHKIDASRVHRYIRYSLNHGHFKLVK
jgi:hypothetical protein